METICFLNKTEMCFYFQFKRYLSSTSNFHIIFLHVFSIHSPAYLKKKNKQNKQNLNLFYIENWSIFSYVHLSS